MKKLLLKFYLAPIIFFSMGVFLSCAGQQIENNSLPALPARTAEIFLYGESHGTETHVNLQFELWERFYLNENMRHLFVEMPYYTAEYINIWMREDTDDILDEVFNDLRGTAFYTPFNREFFIRIKNELPETIFHGTDIGHQYSSTGMRFLFYLEQRGMEGSLRYSLTEEAIEQGRIFYNELRLNHSIRSEMMTGNFIREFDALNGESIMSAFYGAAHVSLGNYPEILGGGITMASRLRERYGNIVHITDLRRSVPRFIEGIPDTIIIGGAEYSSSYFGEQDLSSWSDIFQKREFWRVENAYDIFSDMPATGDVLPFSNFPMLVRIGEVFAIRYSLQDGSSVIRYYRTSGLVWQNMDAAEEFTVNN